MNICNLLLIMITAMAMMTHLPLQATESQEAMNQQSINSDSEYTIELLGLLQDANHLKTNILLNQARALRDLPPLLSQEEIDQRFNDIFARLDQMLQKLQGFHDSVSPASMIAIQMIFKAVEDISELVKN